MAFHVICTNSYSYPQSTRVSLPLPLQHLLLLIVVAIVPTAAVRRQRFSRLGGIFLFINNSKHHFIYRFTTFISSLKKQFLFKSFTQFRFKSYVFPVLELCKLGRFFKLLFILWASHLLGMAWDYHGVSSRPLFFFLSLFFVSLFCFLSLGTQKLSLMWFHFFKILLLLPLHLISILFNDGQLQFQWVRPCVFTDNIIV